MGERQTKTIKKNIYGGTNIYVNCETKRMRLLIASLKTGELYRAPFIYKINDLRNFIYHSYPNPSTHKERVRTDALRVPLNIKGHHPTTIEPTLTKNPPSLISNTCRSAILTSTKWQMNWPTKQPNWTRPDKSSRDATTTTPRC